MSQNLKPLVAEGQKEFFASIYKEYKNEMICLADSILGNPSEAGQVVHDSFLTIAGHLDRLMGYGLPNIWYYARLLVKSKAEKLKQKKNGGKDAFSELWEETLGAYVGQGTMPLKP